jgi:hypothetical protein
MNVNLRAGHISPTSVNAAVWDEQIKFKDPTNEQMRVLEQLWVENRHRKNRLEIMIVEAHEMGVEIESMYRRRAAPRGLR